MEVLSHARRPTQVEKFLSKDNIVYLTNFDCICCENLVLNSTSSSRKTQSLSSEKTLIKKNSVYTYFFIAVCVFLELFIVSLFASDY